MRYDSRFALASALCVSLGSACGDDGRDRIDAAVVDGGDGIDGQVGGADGGGVDAAATPDAQPAGPIEPCVAAGMRSSELIHALIAAEAGGPPVSDAVLATPRVTAFVPTAFDDAPGRLDLAADGSFTFTPGSLAGVFEAGVVLQTLDGDKPGCVQVQVVDATSPGVKTLVGDEWTDPAGWSPPGLPGPAEVAWIPAGDHTVASPVTVGSLRIATGASVMAAGGDVAITADAHVAGAYQGELLVAASVALGGRIGQLGCAGAMTADAPVVAAQLDAAIGGACQLDLGFHRITVAGDANLGTNTALVMTAPNAVLDVGGGFTAAGLVGALSDGSVIIGGDVAVSFAGAPPPPGHDWVLRGAGAQNVAAPALGSVALIGVADVNFATASTITILVSARPTHALGGVVSPQTLLVLPGFSTTTPDALCPAVCDDSAIGGGVCATLCQ
jgi:hypothetical protein